MDRPRDTDLRGGTRALSLFQRPFDLPVVYWIIATSAVEGEGFWNINLKTGK